MSLVLQIAMYQFRGKRDLGEVIHVMYRLTESQPVRQTRKPRAAKCLFASPLAPNLLYSDNLVPLVPWRRCPANFSPRGGTVKLGNRRPEIGGSPDLRPVCFRLLSDTGLRQGLMAPPFLARFTGWCLAGLLFLSLSHLLDDLAWCRFAVPSK